MTRLNALAMMALVAGTAPTLAGGIILVTDIPVMPAMDGLFGQVLSDQSGKPIGKIEDIVAGSDGVSLFVLVRGAEHRQLVSLADIVSESGHKALRSGASAGAHGLADPAPDRRVSPMELTSD